MFPADDRRELGHSTRAVTRQDLSVHVIGVNQDEIRCRLRQCEAAGQQQGSNEGKKELPHDLGQRIPLGVTTQ